MNNFPRTAASIFLLATSAACLAGCHGLGHVSTAFSRFRDDDATPAATSAKRTAADLKFAVGRSEESMKNYQAAIRAYEETVGQDPTRADAYVRLAILHDMQGDVKQSAQYYRKALEADPGNADIYTDVGYSFYLQEKWTEAEMNLRQAIAIRPDHERAHNNLGMVLARQDRIEESFQEFQLGGCSRADAHANVALALSLDRRFPEAAQHYRFALAADPQSAVAKAGLKEVEAMQVSYQPPADGGLRQRMAEVK